MSEQKRLNRPELREKIVRQLKTLPYNCEEEIRKQERERIMEYLKEKSSVDTPEYIDKNGKHWQGGYLIISLKNWQALGDKDES